ncbi:hypothetical protein Tco_1074288 [Tanacetum coccineum]
MYETFNASSLESLDSIFNRLQKIVSQLTILGEIITPEELNLKFLRSLPTEWGHSSTNDVNIANVHVSTGSTPVSTASTNNSIACLSDATVYVYLATQPNGSQVVHEDLDQIHEDDLDEMDLKWQLALLSMKERKFYQRTGKKIIINGSDTAGYDKKKMGQDLIRATWHKRRLLPTLHLWLYLILRGLASVEEQLVFYKKNESMLCDQIAVLKRDASYNESDINSLKKQVERLKKEKEDNQFKINNFEIASKILDQFNGNQIFDNNKKGLGYNVVPPPLTGLFAPSSIDSVKVNKDASENVSKESGLVPFSTARQSFSRTTTLVSAARSFNTAVPSVNVAKPRTNAFQKSHSLLRRPFYQQTALKNRNLNNKVNTAKVISVNTVKGKRMTSAVGEQGINAVKPTTYWAWRPKIKMINHVYKNTGSCICKQFNYVDPTGRNKGGWKKQKMNERSMTNFKGMNYEQEYILLGMTEAKDSEVCKITRADGSSSFHGDIQALLRRLDRQDLSQLYSLVQERFKGISNYGHGVDLWGDLRMIFDPNEEDDIWLNQQY